MTLQAWASTSFPPATQTVEEAIAQKALRRESIVSQYANHPLVAPPTPPKDRFGEYIMSMVARLIKRQDLEAVSKSILTPSFRPWPNGTDIAILGSVCKRVGDYDFVLMGLIKMAYLDEEAGRTLLSPEAGKKLRHELLSLSGNSHHIKFKLRNCPQFIKIKDSENHILMSEVSRYLTNQLLFSESGDAQYDNEKNGFNEWLMKHLAEFLRTDFDELNSRPYQGYTLIAIANLYNYAQDERVKTTAQMILDYLSAKTAVQTKGLRRYVPFRRQLDHRDAQNFLQEDNTAYWYSFHAGNYDYMDMNKAVNPEFRINDYMYFMAATDKYVVPRMVLDLFYDQSTPLFQRIKSRDVEIYYNSASFVLSAGGRYRKVFGYFTRQNDVWAVPTTIIPKNYGNELSQVFSLRGHEKYGKRNNTCVSGNFACGTGLQVPANIPAQCVTKVGAWTFYNLKDCPVNMGFYLATHEVQGKALWEVREPTITFEAFKSLVVANNPRAFASKGHNTFVTTLGKRIVFDWSNTKLKVNPIKSEDDKALGDFDQWDYASGNVIQSSGNGLIVITNPVTGEQLRLDGEVPVQPVRSLGKN